MSKFYRVLSLFIILCLTQVKLVSAGEVVLYSSVNIDAVNSVVTAFNQKYPDIKVSVVRAGTGALMQRIKAEAANPLGDVFWAGGISTIDGYKSYFAPYVSQHAKAVDAQYREPNGLWMGTNVQVNVLMVNTRQLNGQAMPTSWTDLLDPAWKGHIVIPDPEKTSASFVTLYGLSKVLGADKLAQLAKNAVIVSSTAAAYDGVAKGEFSVALTMEYAAYEYVAGGMKNIQLVYPKEGTFLSPEGMAVIKGGKHTDEAHKLYDFLAEKNTQTDIFKTAFRRPLRQDINVSTLSELPVMSSIKVVPLDDKKMTQERDAFLAQWRQMVAQH